MSRVSAKKRVFLFTCFERVCRLLLLNGFPLQKSSFHALATGYNLNVAFVGWFRKKVWRFFSIACIGNNWICIWWRVGRWRNWSDVMLLVAATSRVRRPWSWQAGFIERFNWFVEKSWTGKRVSGYINHNINRTSCDNEQYESECFDFRQHY